MLYIANISETFQDYPDDESLALIVYFRGCSHHCPGCHNEGLQRRIGKGIPEKEAFNLIIKKCSESQTDKIVFSGGDPFYYENREDMLELINSLESDNYNLCVYTGYELGDVEEFYEQAGRDYTKPSFLKCGTYQENLKEKKWGKDNTEFKLVTTNQKFYKWIDGEYKQISDNNILTFT